jgi:beta-lactamase regulating signal transducer with metallopeptidase domain
MLFLFSNHCITDNVLKALCWTFVHSLWQGLLAAVIGGAIICSTRKTKAYLRYNLLVIVFACFMLVVGISFFSQLSHFRSTRENAPLVTISTSNAVPVPFIASTSLFKKESLINNFTAYCNEHAAFIVFLWFLFFTIKCLQVFYALYYIHTLKKVQVSPPLEVWSDKMKQLCKALGIVKPIVLLESGLIDIPFTIGYLKATILVPLGLLANLPPDQVEVVLLHELAHIRRNDYLINLLQSFSETILFFNPALLWISALIRREREACCDDIVLQHRPHRNSYFEALVFFQEYSLTHSGTAMALISQKNDLLQRIKRMLTHKNQNLNTMERTLLMLGIIGITAFSFITKTETPVKNTPHVLHQSKSNFSAIYSNSFSDSNSTDTVKPDFKEVLKHSEEAKFVSKKEKEVRGDSVNSEEAYGIIDGKAFVFNKGGYATTGDFTDIIYVDGKQMTPDEVNKNIKRSDIKGVGATGGEAAQKKYGLNKSVLEIYINTTPERNNMLWHSSSKEQQVLKEQEVTIKEQERAYNESKQLYDQQRQLAMQEKGHQKQEEMMQKQKNKMEKQQSLIKEQEEWVRKQAEQAKEQVKKVNEQRVTVNNVKQEMLKDGLIQQDEHYELIINSREMFIDGKKQTEAVHHKYIELIDGRRKKAFDDKEQWTIKE